MKWTVSLLVLFVLSTTVSAGIGIAKDYLPDNTLIMNKGETYYYNVYLTNTDTNAMTLKVVINGPPSLIYEFVDTGDTIPMPAKTYNKPVKVKLITKPDAPMGEKYRVDIKLTTTGESGGMISVSNEVGEHFFIQIGQVLRTTTTLPGGKCKEGFKDVNGQCVRDTGSSGGGFNLFGSDGVTIIVAVIFIAILGAGIYLLKNPRKAAPLRSAFGRR